MNEIELQEKVSSILKQSFGGRIFLVLKVNGEYTLRAVGLNKKYAPEIRQLFKDQLLTSIVNNKELVLRKLTEDEDPNAIYQYNYSDYPEVLELFKNFDAKEAHDNIDTFNFYSDSLQDLFGYIITIGDTPQPYITLFKKHYPYFLIKRDSFLLGLGQSSESFEKLPNEDILRLSGDVQLLRIDGQLFVLDLKVLERNMGFMELIKRDAKSAIDSIEKLDILDTDSINKLNEKLDEDPTYTRKLAKLIKNSPIFETKVTKDKILKFVKRTSQLKKVFKYNDGDSHIKLSTEKAKKAFVDLLNDSYLRSKITKQNYVAISKDKLTKASN